MTKEQLYSTASYKAKDLGAFSWYFDELSGWNLSGQNLEATYAASAKLIGTDLSHSQLNRGRFEYTNFTAADLSHAAIRECAFYASNLTDAKLIGSIATGTYFSQVTFANADLTDAIIKGSSFDDTTSRGFTKEQLYSTASYKAKDLGSVTLSNNNLASWSFAGQNLTGANFAKSSLTNASFAGADLSSVDLSETNVTGTDFTDAVITNAYFSKAVGFTKGQLTSSASYENRHLGAIDLSNADLPGLDLAGFQLQGAKLVGAKLNGADLSGADLTGTDFSSSDLANANLRRTNAAGAKFHNLQNADLSEADLTGATLGFNTGAILTDAIVKGTALFALTSEQLYSTASYKQKDLGAVRIAQNASGWDFRDQYLAGGDFSQADVSFTDFNGADLLRARFSRGHIIGADFTHANLAQTELGQTSYALVDFSFADMRGASTFGFARPPNEPAQLLKGGVGSLRNTIMPDGSVQPLLLEVGEFFVVRDYDARPNFNEDLIAIGVYSEFRSDGRVRMLLDSDAWDSTISFQPGISVALGGDLELAFAPGVDPASQIGRTFKLFDWTGVTPNGRFEVASDYQWDTANLYSTGEVTLIPEPGAWSMATVGLLLATLGQLRARNRGKRIAILKRAYYSGAGVDASQPAAARG